MYSPYDCDYYFDPNMVMGIFSKIYKKKCQETFIKHVGNLLIHCFKKSEREIKFYKEVIGQLISTFLMVLSRFPGSLLLDRIEFIASKIRIKQRPRFILLFYGQTWKRKNGLNVSPLKFFLIVSYFKY